jgi:cytochrome c oxidase cbb3-type subunit III
MRYARGIRLGLYATLVVAALPACRREERRYTEVPPTAGPEGATELSSVLPGSPAKVITVASPYQGNAWAISEGKQLFNQMNCVGCHAHGGGGMGPPLMDDEWIYGSEPENIYDTIVNGRPNGMPAWRDRLSNQQVWELVAYVRSMSGIGPKAARSGRDDNMMVRPSEQRRRQEEPKRSFTPRSSEMP